MEDQMLAVRHRLPGVHERLRKGTRGQSVSVTLPFRCPRCGESTRFRSLTSLRAHLRFSHTFPSPFLAPPLPIHSCPEDNNHAPSGPDSTPVKDNNHAPSEPDPTPVSINAAVKVPPLLSSLDHTREGVSMEEGLPPLLSLLDHTREGVSMEEGLPPLPSSLDHTREGVAMEEELQLRLWVALKKAEQQLQSEHAQWELHSEHAQLEKHSLRGQIHSAAMVIASLRQQLAISKQQLEQRESEVLSMQSWLSLATQHELRSKDNLRTFIESLLQRLYLAERRMTA